MKRSGYLARRVLLTGGSTLEPRGYVPPRAKSASKRKRLKAQRDHQYGRDALGDFAAFVRQAGCVVGRRCVGSTQAAHLFGRGAHPELSGVGNMAGLCAQHHTEQGSLTAATFNDRHSINFAHECARLKALWEDR